MTIRGLEEDVLTVPEVARVLRRSEKSVRTLLKEQKLAGVRVNRQWLVLRSALEKLLREGTGKGSSD